MADPLLNQREENRTPTTSPIEDTGAASLSRMPGDYLVDKLVIKLSMLITYMVRDSVRSVSSFVRSFVL